VYAENFFVKIADRGPLITCIMERLSSPPDLPGKQPAWGLDLAYDLKLATDQNRRIAISPVVDGWVAGIESRQVLDLRLLQNLSERLEVDVLACQISTSVDYFGYARCVRGEVVEVDCKIEGAEDPVSAVRAFLQRHLVPFNLTKFQEAIRSGWDVLQASKRLPEYGDGDA